MSVHLHWFLPTGGDGRTLVDRHAYAPNAPAAPGVRAPDIDYLAQIARAADQLGFEAVLTPTGTWCEDAWLTTVALSQHTERLKFLVAFRPGVISPRTCGADGGDVPEDHPGAAAAQCRHRRRFGGAAALRRPSGPRRALRPDG